MPQIACTHCGASLKAPENVLGKNVRCPKCGEKFLASAEPTISDDPFDLGAIAPSDDPLSMPLAAPIAPVAAANPLATTALPAPTSPTSSSSANTKKTAERPPWLVPVGIGCGVILVLGVFGVGAAAILGIAAVAATGEGGAFENLGRPNGTIDVARDAQAGEWSPQPRAMPTDGVDWKVTVDGAAPATRLLSAIPIRFDERYGSFACSGRSAKAATLMPADGGGLRWTKYDLTKREPIGQTLLREGVRFENNPSQFRSALSPSGARLAFVSPFAEPATPTEILVFDESGAELPLVASEKLKHELQWLALPTETRLLVQIAGTLYGYDVDSGEKKFEVAGFRDEVRLSPGAKFAAGLTDEGIVWISCEDGSRCGLSPVPAAWYEPAKNRRPMKHFEGKRPGRVTFHPEGKTAALLVTDVHGDLHVTEIDVATGKVRDCFVLTWLRSQRDLGLDAVWTSERQILLSSWQLVDLDAKTWLIEYQLDWPMLANAPDDRYWRIYTVLPAKVEALTAKLGPLPAGQWSEPTLLAATTVPDAESAAQIAEAKSKGLFWHLGAPVRLEINGYLPSAEKEKTIEVFADAVAKRGHRIDPDAEIAVRLNIGVDDGTVVGRTEAAYNPNYQYEFYEQGKVGQIRFSVVDRDGQPIFAGAGSGETQSTYDAGGEEAVWRSLRSRIPGLSLPRIYLRDAQGKRLKVSLYSDVRIPVGIDDVLPADKVTDTPTDYFALPADGAR